MYTAVITIKRVKSFVNKGQISFANILIFNLVDKRLYAFYGYNGSIRPLPFKKIQQSTVIFFKSTNLIFLVFVKFNSVENRHMWKKSIECFFVYSIPVSLSSSFEKKTKLTPMQLDFFCWIFLKGSSLSYMLFAKRNEYPCELKMSHISYLFILL